MAPIPAAFDSPTGPDILRGMSKAAPAVAPRRQPEQTRERLLDCAFAEIQRSGFRAASLDAILEQSGVTKGALYHHFGSKAELGLAVIEERLRPWVEAGWKPALAGGPLIDAAIALCRSLGEQRGRQMFSQGCPFNNLIAELGGEEPYRSRLRAILEDWRAGLVEGLREAQRRGELRADAEPEAAAAFIIAGLEGSVGLARLRQSREFLDASLRGLMQYLASLRAPCA